MWKIDRLENILFNLSNSRLIIKLSLIFDGLWTTFYHNVLLVLSSKCTSFCNWSIVLVIVVIYRCYFSLIYRAFRNIIIQSVWVLNIRQCIIDDFGVFNDRNFSKGENLFINYYILLNFWWDYFLNFYLFSLYYYLNRFRRRNKSLNFTIPV